jgi:LPS sulfotransferase NodH
MHDLLARDSEPHALRFLAKHRDRFALLATNGFVSRLHYARQASDPPPPDLPIPVRAISGEHPDVLSDAELADPRRVVIVADPAGEDRRLETLRARHPDRRLVGLAGELLPALVARTGHTLLDPAPLPPRPTRAVILFASPRSGSSLVADVMSDMGLGDVREHLRGGVLDLLRSDYQFDRAAALDRFVRLAARNGTFGTKIITHFFTDFVRDGGDIDLARSVYAGIDVALLTLDRTDKIAQSVSSEVASRRGVWHVTDAASAAALQDSPEVGYRFSSLLARYMFYRQQSEIVQFVARSRGARLSLLYERDVEAGDLPALAERLCASLLLDRDAWTFPRAGARQRIADTTNADMARRFSSDMAQHFGCPA